MKAKAENLVQSSNAQAKEMPVQVSQIFGPREVMSLSAAAREYFAQFLRSFADTIEFGNGSLQWRQKIEPKGTESPCEDCQDRSKCEKACKRLESLLPSVTKGRGSKENMTGLHVETLKHYKHTRQLEIFQEYQSCKDLFTERQWDVLCLYYDKGLTQKEIAEATGKKRSAVSGLLGRARNAKTRHLGRMREEYLAQRMRNTV